MWALPVARPPDLTQRGQAKIPISHSLHGRSLTACYSSCCYILVLAGILPGAYQCQGTLPTHTLLPLTCSDNKTKLPASPQKELVHTSRAKTFFLCLLRWCLKSSSSESQWNSSSMSLTGLYKAKQNSSFWMGSKHFPQLSSPGSVWREQTRILIFQCLLERNLTAYFPSHMLSEDPASSIQPAWSQLGSSQESERVAGTSHSISPGSFSSKTKSLASFWKEFVHTSSIQLLWLLEELAPKSPGSGNWQGSVVTRSPRSHKTSRQFYMGAQALSVTFPYDLAQSKQSHPALGFFLIGPRLHS